MTISTGFYAVKTKLEKRLEESAPGRVQILTGPRQVGKTSILLDICRRWNDSAIYLAADAAEAALPGWWEIQWERVLELARVKKTFLLIDEVQYLPDWADQLNAAIEQVDRERLPLHIVATGSTSVELDLVVGKAMADRYECHEIRQWSARDLAEGFSLTQSEAVDCFVRFGSFPAGMSLRTDVSQWKAFMRESMIGRSVGRDLMMLESIRKPVLLRQAFSVCVRHATEIMSLEKVGVETAAAGNLQTITHYLGFLETAYLVSLVQKFSTRKVRIRASTPKLVPLSNALMAALREGDPPTAQSDPATWCRWVENACMAFAIGCEQSVYYWKDDSLEVDAIIDGSWGKWAVEIHTGEYTTQDLRGLREFCRRWPEYRPVILGDPNYVETARKLGIRVVPWTDFLWDGLAALKR